MLKLNNQPVFPFIVMDRDGKEFTASISLVKKEFISLSNVLEFLHDEELCYFNSLKYERRIWSYVLGRLSAKLAVQQLSKISFLNSIYIESGVFGYPVINSEEATNLQVSITHTEAFGMSLAFKETHPMGIDIEEIGEDKSRAISTQITINELNLLHSLAIDNRSSYTMLWCAKEALSKVLKTGMMLDFKFLEIDTITLSKTSYVFFFKNFGQYKALCHANKEYAISIVLPRKTEIVLDAIWKGFDEHTIR